MYGINILLAMNPGTSIESVVVFPISWARETVLANVAGEVCSPGMISTNFITGTGFIKCIPITCSGLVVEEAIFVMEMDDVLVANPDIVTIMKIMSKPRLQETERWRYYLKWQIFSQSCPANQTAPF